MLRLFSFVFAVSILAAGIPARAQDAFALKSVSVDLPFSDRMFPKGPGAEAANSYCLICHSVGMVLTQPALPRPAWEAEVQKMRNTYKAPIPEDQVATIVSYLAALKISEAASP